MKYVVKSMSARIALLFALLLVGMTAVAGAGRVSAQDASASHPAHIHTGTCASPGDVVAPLSNVSSAFLVDGTETAGQPAGSTDAVPVEMSTTKVEMALADIVGSDHLIMVHESDENIQNYIACGDIGGVMMGDSDLPIGLTAVNDSGYAGVAMLHDDGYGSTTVTVSLVMTGSGGQAATDGSTSADSSGESSDTAASAEDGGPTTHAISIKDFAFNPSELEIKVGDTVTWTNDDSVPHTATQRPSGSGFQSGTISPGESFSFTFDSAGEFDYYCEFHANMAGSIIVTE